MASQFDCKFTVMINFPVVINHLFYREATKYIMGLLTPLREEERGQWLEKLVDIIQKQGLESTNIDKSHVEKAAKVFLSTNQCGWIHSPIFIQIVRRNAAKTRWMKLLIY